MKQKRDKYIQKALSSLGLRYTNSEHEFELNNLKDLEFLIAHRKGLLHDLEVSIEEAKEAMEQLKNEIQVSENIKHQVEVEKVKELNPHYQVF
jgi:mevalonate kinase